MAGCVDAEGFEDEVVARVDTVTVTIVFASLISSSFLVVLSPFTCVVVSFGAVIAVVVGSVVVTVGKTAFTTSSTSTATGSPFWTSCAAGAKDAEKAVRSSLRATAAELSRKERAIKAVRTMKAG